jgi:hypothetical protein
MGMCVDAATDMDSLKKAFNLTTLTVNDKTSWKEAKDKFLGLFSVVVDTIEKNMNTVTDIGAVVGKYEEKLEAKDKIIQGLEDKEASLKKRKEEEVRKIRTHRRS